MIDSSAAFLSGAVRGAWKGAVIGVAAVGTLGLIAATGGFGAVSAFVGATNVFTIGFTALINFAAPIFTGVGALAVGGSALIGGVYKGVTSSVEQRHAQYEKEEMAELAQSASNIEKERTPQRTQSRANYVPPKAPNVAKDEMPKSWVKAETDRRKKPRQQGRAGHSH